MRYDRTAIGTAQPFKLDAVKDHMRVAGNDEDTGIAAMAGTAASEVEAYCDLALITQTITCTTDTWPGQDVALPVGPVAADATITVELLESDGTATPVASGFWLESGRYPVLHFNSIPGGRLRIEYPAGYGDAHTDIPADLSHAIMDHALKLYDRRGDVDSPATMAPATARICARYRRVRVDA